MKRLSYDLLDMGGKLLEVDTTDVARIDYQMLFDEIQSVLGRSDTELQLLVEFNQPQSH